MSNCGVSRNSIFIQQSHLVLPSPLALLFLIALACLCVVVSLLVSVVLLQGVYSQTEKFMYGERVRHKIASRGGRALSGKLNLVMVGRDSGKTGVTADCNKLHPALCLAPHGSGKWAEWHDARRFLFKA